MIAFVIFRGGLSTPVIWQFCPRNLTQTAEALSECLRYRTEAHPDRFQFFRAQWCSGGNGGYAETIFLIPARMPGKWPPRGFHLLSSPARRSRCIYLHHFLPRPGQQTGTLIQAADFHGNGQVHMARSLNHCSSVLRLRKFLLHYFLLLRFCFCGCFYVQFRSFDAGSPDSETACPASAAS